MAAGLPGPPALTQPFPGPCCPLEPGVPAEGLGDRGSQGWTLEFVPLVTSARPREERNHFTRMWSLNYSFIPNNDWNLAASDKLLQQVFES